MSFSLLFSLKYLSTSALAFTLLCSLKAQAASSTEDLAERNPHTSLSSQFERTRIFEALTEASQIATPTPNINPHIVDYAAGSVARTGNISSSSSSSVERTRSRFETLPLAVQWAIGSCLSQRELPSFGLLNRTTKALVNGDTSLPSPLYNRLTSVTWDFHRLSQTPQRFMAVLRKVRPGLSLTFPATYLPIEVSSDSRIEDLNKVRKVEIWGSHSVTSILPFVTHFSNVNQLKFSLSFIPQTSYLERPYSALAPAISRLPLTELNLSYSMVDRFREGYGILEIVNGCQPTLQVLNLAGVERHESDNYPLALARHPLRELACSTSINATDALAIIDTCPALEKLDLRAQTITEGWVERLTQKISEKSPYLHTLVLGEYHHNDWSVPEFAEAPLNRIGFRKKSPYDSYIWVRDVTPSISNDK